jgi:hypothetical protein
VPRSTSPTPGELIILGSGTAALVFSFFDFYTFGELGVDVWARGLFPLAAVAVLCIAFMGVQVAFTRLARMDISSRPFGFTWEQVHLALAFFATILSIAFWLTDGGFGRDFGIGFWGIFAASIGALVGAAVLQRERSGRGETSY